ncbi:hypothetical protein M406DRAFT_332897 [Cryphonectria parasitica EP155]|uniref:SUZ-C domain-containing protein n=1 Tax=Cryphonectria parasitica (strain ATCC 38755 / EP155) TaxID=660469 RepID=A0A9P5CM55_CRYP1|nr:uncharacterized protein M406DRAFT_332897 [Cryphonectria parasitica EP155]KAF3762515.1 hypothetical protein M406DRAFT_332897 [Cryphonectria parasitica EP155]
MGNKTAADAWDDDWVTQADRVAKEENNTPEPQAPKTKQERIAQHRELQRKLWEEAEEPPQMPYHVAASSNVPFAQGFKPQMKLLSRKPVKKVVDPVTGIEKLMLEDDDEDDRDKKPQLPTAAEIEEKRKQKERDYEERRAKLFGTPPPETTSGATTPGATTPPLVGENSRGNYRGRGRGRGGRGGRGGQRNEGYKNDLRNDSRSENYRGGVRNDSQDGRPGNSNGGSPYRELFDPDASSRSASRPQRGGATSSPTRGPESAIRAPRGPDSSGARGFGFANRGAKEG